MDQLQTASSLSKSAPRIEWMKNPSMQVRLLLEIRERQLHTRLTELGVMWENLSAELFLHSPWRDYCPVKGCALQKQFKSILESSINERLNTSGGSSDPTDVRYQVQKLAEVMGEERERAISTGEQAAAAKKAESKAQAEVLLCHEQVVLRGDSEDDINSDSIAEVVDIEPEDEKTKRSRGRKRKEAMMKQEKKRQKREEKLALSEPLRPDVFETSLIAALSKSDEFEDQRRNVVSAEAEKHAHEKDMKLLEFKEAERKAEADFQRVEQAKDNEHKRKMALYAAEIEKKVAEANANLLNVSAKLIDERLP